jgi:hypothetical protein
MNNLGNDLPRPDMLQYITQVSVVCAEGPHFYTFCRQLSLGGAIQWASGLTYLSADSIAPVALWEVPTCWFLALEFFYPEDGGDTFLRNIGSHKIYTAPHPRKQHSS